MEPLQTSLVRASYWFWLVVTMLVGLCIGSFLNVVIYRLPRATETLNLSRPTWSFCPNCQRQLTALDLVPLFSFLLLGRRCRGCKEPISWRYFGVELLTGLLFVALYVRFWQNMPTCVTLLLMTAVFVAVFFIDFDTYTIPDTLNIVAFLLAVGRDVYGIVLHEPGHELLWGWLPRSLWGALIGALIFGVIRVIGWIWKGVEAMGLGDVLLGRAMGAMLISLVPATWNPLGLLPAWALMSVFAGAIIGGPLILYRSKQAAKTAQPAPSEPEEDGPFEREGTLGQQLLEVGWCLWLGDIGSYLRFQWSRLRGQPIMEAPEEEEEWTPAPSAIPFGPFMVVGFLAAAFWGEMLTAAYLNYLFPPSPPGPF